LNTDEAIAIGAVYQAAALSKGFKVKKFAVQELQLYPIQVRVGRVFKCSFKILGRFYQLCY
jgi:hypoxia up-regulated 1